MFIFSINALWKNKIAVLVGDFLFVNKMIYGFSKYSCPFNICPISGRLLSREPSRGDIVVFRHPTNDQDYIKRLIGLPGDKIQFVDGDLYINDNQVLKTRISVSDKIYCGNSAVPVNTFEEKLPNGVKYNAVYKKNFSYQTSDEFIVPLKHYFFLGDNRDCSKDSRYLSSVGYVHKNNLVGKAQFIFFSSDVQIGSIFKFWEWSKILRINRFFKKIK